MVCFSSFFVDENAMVLWGFSVTWFTGCSLHVLQFSGVVFFWIGDMGRLPWGIGNQLVNLNVFYLLICYLTLKYICLDGFFI